MGQFISHNDNCNDELINTLIKRDYIRTMDVEKVFRCVDRGFYYTSDDKRNAYRDSAWQSDQIHLSAPCVYATVLECLELHPGHRFLNIGSGIGYFSTVAGLLLGRNGVNHGIEIHQLLIDLAYQKMDEFKLNAAAIDHHDFCEPIFIQGNVCDLMPLGYYDRVYCGAGVPPEESEFMKSLINIGGVLIMPLDGYLVKITRKDTYEWDLVEILEVSFTNLVVPEKCAFNTVKFPTVEPLSLQELCRSNIRSLLRENLKQEFPSVSMLTKCNLKTYNSEENKNINFNDPLTQFVRIQYGVNEDGLVSLRNIVDTFAGLDGAISDTGSTSSLSSDEYNEEALEDDNENMRLQNEALCNTDSISSLQDAMIAQTSDESAKRKTQAEGSEQNKTFTETENPKRMKMDSPPQNTVDAPSTSSNSRWQTLYDSLSSSVHTEDSESLISIDDDDDNFERDEDIGLYQAFLNNSSISSSDSDESITDSEISRELFKYHFRSERKENELSKLLKDKIDTLPIPNPIKFFLNYNRID